MKKDPHLDPVYRMLLGSRGEEYAELYLASEEDRLAYIRWWQENYQTENDQIKDLGLEPEYFSNSREAKKFLAEMEEYQPKKRGG